MSREPDLIDQLTDDHRRLEGLLDRLDSETDPAELRSVYLQLVAELAAHEACEQQVLFPAVGDRLPSATDEVGTCLAEHDEINQLLDEMRGLRPASWAFTKRTSALVLDLSAHFADEEQLFHHARTALDHDELAALNQRACQARGSAAAFPPVEASQL